MDLLLAIIEEWNLGQELAVVEVLLRKIKP
jgi:hypothetical protein